METSVLKDCFWGYVNSETTCGWFLDDKKGDIRLCRAKGDELHLVETEEGIVLTPFNPEFPEWAKAYERTNRKYRNTLKALAK